MRIARQNELFSQFAFVAGFMNFLTEEAIRVKSRKVIRVLIIFSIYIIYTYIYNLYLYRILLVKQYT